MKKSWKRLAGYIFFVGATAVYSVFGKKNSGLLESLKKDMERGPGERAEGRPITKKEGPEAKPQPEENASQALNRLEQIPSGAPVEAIATPHSGGHAPYPEAERALAIEATGDPEATHQEIRNGPRIRHLQPLDVPKLPGWTLPRPDKVPVPTYTPATMAFGIVVFAFGLASVWYVCAVGAAVTAFAVWRWVVELVD